MRGLLACALVACNSTGGGNATPPSGSAAGSGSGSAITTAKHGSGGGFAASLTAEIAEDNGSAAPAPVPTATGSSAAPTPPPATGSATGPIADSAPPQTPNAPTAGIDKTVTNHDISKADTAASGPPKPSEKYVHVNPSPELAAIKLDMEPNWDRDFETAGTISFVLRVPSSGDTRVFSFNYGYDFPGAPNDRDAYKKFLADRRVLDVTLDRQKGAAWYLEGNDDAGQPAFRYLVLYGGKRLTCYGSLYKTREATALGPDLRDKVVSAAKKICETIAL
ncbi:MAG TPA: hypothetical protein VGG28_02965 [Kofleriaceae bacterium]